MECGKGWMEGVEGFVGVVGGVIVGGVGGGVGVVGELLL